MREAKQVEYSLKGGLRVSIKSPHICQTILKWKRFVFEPELVLALTAAIINHERAKGGRTDPKGGKKKSGTGVEQQRQRDLEVCREQDEFIAMWRHVYRGDGGVENREIRQVGL